MPFLNRIMPFLIAVILIAATAFSLVLFAYLFVICAVIGIVLYALNRVQHHFQSRMNEQKEKTKKRSGRIIESDDWRKL